MMIYAARHGQTEWNAQNRICGSTDIPLTEKGLQQAAELAEKAACEPIDVILCSPMIRARQTAAAIAEKLHLPVITDDRLREQDFGIYEGEDRGSQAFWDNKREFTVRFPNGESHMQVAARVYALLDEVRTTYAGKNVLLVCHGSVSRVIRTYFVDMTTEEYVSYSPPNCALVGYETEALS